MLFSTLLFFVLATATTAANTDRLGLIILGNSGVGKSFLANLFLPTERFVHKSTPLAVTRKTEFVERKIGSTKYVIFNIPGLVEANQERIDTNKKEIDKAFKECPNSVVIFVFGSQNGRIPNQDIVAFNALHDAYPFSEKALILVANAIPPLDKRGESYEGETIVVLNELLNMKTFGDVVFLDIIDTKNRTQKQQLVDKLLPSVAKSMPHEHTKKHDIHLEADQIKGLTNQVQEITDRFKKQEKEWESRYREAQAQYIAHQGRLDPIDATLSAITSMLSPLIHDVYDKFISTHDDEL